MGTFLFSSSGDIIKKFQHNVRQDRDLVRIDGAGNHISVHTPPSGAQNLPGAPSLRFLQGRLPVMTVPGDRASSTARGWSER